MEWVPYDKHGIPDQLYKLVGWDHWGATIAVTRSDGTLPPNGDQLNVNKPSKDGECQIEKKIEWLLYIIKGSASFRL